MRGTANGGRIAAIVLIAGMVGLGWASLPARAENEGWAVQFGTPANDNARGLSAVGGDVYVYGSTVGTLPGQTSAGGRDLHLHKLDTRGNVLWTRQFGSPGPDDALGGNLAANTRMVVVSGFVTGALPGQTQIGVEDAFLRAYDPDGNILWTRQFGTTAGDSVRELAMDPQGDIYVAAQTLGTLPGQTSAGARDAVVMKFGSDGTLLWTYQFGSTAVDEAIGVDVRDKHVYATGVVQAGGALPGQVSAGATDSFVIKLTAADGQRVWLKQFGSAGGDSAWRVHDLANGVYISGHTSGSLGAPNVGDLDPFLVRMDVDGNIQWIRQFGSTGQDFSVALSTHEGGIVIAGVANAAMPGETTVGGPGDFYARKYDQNGDVLWTRQWGTVKVDEVRAAVAHGSALYVSGTTMGAMPGYVNAGRNDAVVIRLPLQEGSVG